MPPALRLLLPPPPPPMQLVILDAHSRKKAEQAAFKAALSEALAERDAEAKALLLGYEKGKKALLRSMAARSADPEEQVRQRGAAVCWCC